MNLRQVPEAFVDKVMLSPEQIVAEQGGRKAYQSRMDFGNGRIFLLRVIVKDDVDPTVVITVYRTPKIEKYGR